MTAFNLDDVLGLVAFHDRTTDDHTRAQITVRHDGDAVIVTFTPRDNPAAAQRFRVTAERLPEATMTVRVRDGAAEEAAWGRGPFNPIIRTVTINATCPRCGGPRGPVKPMNQHEDGVWFNTDTWENPCGHRDMYQDVLAEAKAHAAAADGAA